MHLENVTANTIFNNNDNTGWPKKPLPNYQKIWLNCIKVCQ